MRIILPEDYRHNPSFGSIILEDLYTSSGRIIILPIGRYLHVLTFLSGIHLGVVMVASEEGAKKENWFLVNSPFMQDYMMKCLGLEKILLSQIHQALCISEKRSEDVVIPCYTQLPWVWARPIRASRHQVSH